jgi:hypothetical protein
MPNCRFNADKNAPHFCRLTLALGLFKEILWQLFEYWRAIGQARLTAQRKQAMRRATGLPFTA